MIHLHKDPTARLLKSYLPPFKGTWTTLPSYILPDDALSSSLNTTLLGGLLRSRCGLKSYNSTNLGNKVLGSFLSVDTLNNKYPFCGTRNKVYRYVNNNWSDITSVIPLTASNDSVVRFTSLQLGTLVYVFYTNGTDPLKIISQSGYNLDNITAVSGSIPTMTDICTSFSRVVGITPPYTIQWCDAINNTYVSYQAWPSLNQAILADTEDSLVCIGSLGTLGVAVYKEGNIFVGIAQSGPNSQAFRFEHRGEYEGPANPNARVSVNGTHIYMTPTGRVGLFDGTQQAYICDGIWPTLQDTIDEENTNHIFGVYDYKTAQVTFWYPRVGDNGASLGMLTIDIPFPLAGIQSYSYFIGQSNFPCSNGLSIRLFQANSSPLIFGNNNQTFTLDKHTYTDNLESFSCSAEPGLFRPTRVEGDNDFSDIYKPIFEILATRDSSRGEVHISSVTSSMLENDGNLSQSQIMDLSKTHINDYIAFNSTGSFLGLKMEWDSTAKFEYKGANVYGRKLP